MVDQAADGCVYIAGGHRAHQIKADIYQFYAVRVCAGVLHDAADQGLRKLRTGITDRLALGHLCLNVNQHLELLRAGALAELPFDLCRFLPEITA